jgi:hypothetical protein
VAFFFNDTALDALLGVIDGANALHICSGTAPANRAAVISASLADVAVDAGDFTLADHATSGRQVTVAAQTGVAVDVSGTPTYYCLIDGTNILAYTEVNPASPNLTSGSTVDIPAVVFSVADPVLG